jgi:flagellar protein FliO/FliZ
MITYFLKLALILPLLGLMIWGSLKLTKIMQSKLAEQTSEAGGIRLVETAFVAPGMRLAVVEFRGREILLGCSKQGLTRLAESDAEVAATDTGQLDG